TRDAGVALGIGNKTVARSLARLTALGLLTSKHTEKDEGRARAARYEVNRSWELNTLTDTLYSNGGVSGYSVSLSNFDYITERSEVSVNGSEHTAYSHDAFTGHRVTTELILSALASFAARDGLTVREIATATRLSTDTVRKQLRRMISPGLVQAMEW